MGAIAQRRAPRAEIYRPAVTPWRIFGVAGTARGWWRRGAGCWRGGRPRWLGPDLRERRDGAVGRGGSNRICASGRRRPGATAGSLRVECRASSGVSSFEWSVELRAGGELRAWRRAGAQWRDGRDGALTAVARADRPCAPATRCTTQQSPPPSPAPGAWPGPAPAGGFAGAWPGPAPAGRFAGAWPGPAPAGGFARRVAGSGSATCGWVRRRVAGSAACGWVRRRLAGSAHGVDCRRRPGPPHETDCRHARARRRGHAGTDGVAQRPVSPYTAPVSQ